jgi:hypothetical protein
LFIALPTKLIIPSNAEIIPFANPIIIFAGPLITLTIASQIGPIFSFTVSQFLYSKTPAAIRAIIPATTQVIGLASIAPFNPNIDNLEASVAALNNFKNPVTVCTIDIASIAPFRITKAPTSPITIGLIVDQLLLIKL